MRETPAEFTARTGQPPPRTDVSIAGVLLGSQARPPHPDEPCPTLFRDVCPLGLSLYLEGQLTRLPGTTSPCTYMRDATLPGYSSCVQQFGVLVFLQPLTLGPWFSGQSGIWVAEPERLPPPDTLAFVPAGENLPALDQQLLRVGQKAELRELLGGARYDDRVQQGREALRQYLEDLAYVERFAAPARAMLLGVSSSGRDRAQEALDQLGLTEKDLCAPWYHLAASRRDQVRALLPDLTTRLAGHGGLTGSVTVPTPGTGG